MVQVIKTTLATKREECEDQRSEAVCLVLLPGTRHLGWKHQYVQPLQ